jgi:hypothetical protein
MLVQQLWLVVLFRVETAPPQKPIVMRQEVGFALVPGSTNYERRLQSVVPTTLPVR